MPSTAAGSSTEGGAEPPRLTGLERNLERLATLLLGLSILSWGVLGLLRAEPQERLTPVRLGLAALHLLVGVLMLARRPLLVRASAWELAAGVPSFVLGGAVMSLARPYGAWPLAAEVLFLLGELGVGLSLLSLGRCFAILPGARGVITRGPYRLVRHPAYLCELLMTGGATLSLGLWPGSALWVGSILLIALRISAEERPLRGLEPYRVYRERVRFRLVPGLW